MLLYKFLFFFSDFLEIERGSFAAFLNFQLGEEIASFQPLVQKLTKNLNFEDDVPEGHTTMTISFLSENYKFLRPTLNIEESILLSKTYCCHFYVPVQYFTEIQWVFLGTLPLLTRRGHFIINGTPRVILHQIVRSPGIYFHKELQKKSSRLFYAEIISQRGPWVRLEIDKKKKIWISFQASTKIPLHRFFQNFSQKFLDLTPRITNANGATHYYSSKRMSYIKRLQKKFYNHLRDERIGKNSRREMRRIHGDCDLGQEGRLRLNKRLGLSLKTLTLTPIDFLAISNILLNLDTSNIFSTDDIDDLKNRRLKTIGELLQNQLARGFDRLKKISDFDRISFEKLSLLKNLEHSRPTLQYKKEEQKVPYSKKKVTTFMNRIHNPLMSQKQLQFLLTKLQFKRYFLWNVKLKQQSQSMTFNKKSLYFSFHYPINSTLKEFFHSHQLSQYLDQSNPLAEITHKRRLSCLGSGGINRDTAGMEIRGIHQSHYGRICPIETPEGKNAGLVNSLTMTVHLNNKGFLETPYLEIYKQHSQNQKPMLIFSAEDQETKNVFLSQKLPKLRNISVGISQIQNFQKCLLNSIHLVAFNPQQFLSIATTCIPFIEHDDANRALMGSNMQRQALPLISLEPPFVTTFNSFRIFSDLKDIPTNSDTGLVLYVSQQKISIYQRKNMGFSKEWPKQNYFSGAPAQLTLRSSSPKAMQLLEEGRNLIVGGNAIARRGNGLQSNKPIPGSKMKFPSQGQQQRFTKQNISFLKFQKNID